MPNPGAFYPGDARLPLDDKSAVRFVAAEQRRPQRSSLIDQRALLEPSAAERLHGTNPDPAGCAFTSQHPVTPHTRSHRRDPEGHQVPTLTGGLHTGLRPTHPQALPGTDGASPAPLGNTLRHHSPLSKKLPPDISSEPPFLRF